MVTYEELQAYMKTQAEQDRERTYVHVTGDTVEEALRQAAIELGVAIRKIDYEVIEQNRTGVFGIGKRACSILAYPAVRSAEEQDLTSDDSGYISDAIGSQDADGEVFVRLDPAGVLLKVTPPRGKGVACTERKAVQALSERGVDAFDRKMVSKVVKFADGQHVRVADYDHNPANDVAMSVELSDDEMSAWLTLLPPGLGGADPSYDAIAGFLQSHGIVYGFDTERIRRLEDEPSYRDRVKVAEGSQPKNGADAYIAYSFQTDTSQLHLKEKDGRVDFKELNLIQNVVEGQTLAKKVPAERGEAGRTVTDQMIAAEDGKDVTIEAGKNVTVTEDGMKALADINGQVVIAAGKLNVEPVYVVAGDVNLKTGNVLFLGTVLVKGNVDDGFSVKAAGNIEVMGSVGKCDLDAEGDVVVHQGIAGKGGGNVRSGKGVWAKFIENANVESADLVVVSDGIINSRVRTDKAVICKGKRASIVGGRISASEEIKAKTFGSVGGMETVLEVGYDPKSKTRLEELTSRLSEIEDELEDVLRNLQTIQAMHKQRRKLSKDKIDQARELQRRKNELVRERDELTDESEELKNYLSQIRTAGRISASGVVHPGVKVWIKDASLDVRNEFKQVSFVASSGTVKVEKYEEADDDIPLKRSD